jgi:hypothetical protein
MRKGNKKCTRSQGPIVWIRSRLHIICTSRILKFIVTLILFSLCPTGFAADFYSGNQYTFSTYYNENYIYQWSASAGDYNENGQDTFSWVAPDVKMPEEISISLSIIDKTCSCHANYYRTITVNPIDETKLNVESISNSTNSTKFNDSIEMIGILSNNTENSTIKKPIENYAKLDPVSEEPNNVTSFLNLTLDAVSMADSTSIDLDRNHTAIFLNALENNTKQDLEAKEQKVDSSTESQSDSSINQDTLAKELMKTEILSQVGSDLSQVSANTPKDEVDPADTTVNPSETKDTNNAIDQNDITAIATLDFGEGAKIDVIFEKTVFGIYIAHIVLDEDDDMPIGSSSQDYDIRNSASVENMNQTSLFASNEVINQTATMETALENPVNVSSLEDSSKEMSNTVSPTTEASANVPGEIEALPKNIDDQLDSLSTQSSDARANPEAFVNSPETIETLSESINDQMDPLSTQSSNTGANPEASGNPPA